MGSIQQVSVLRGANRPTRLPKVDRLHRLFTESANRFPGDTALIYQDINGTVKESSFCEVEKKSNKLARAILAAVTEDSKIPAKPNNDGDFVVAVALPPSDDLLLALLAIWKAGAAYLPLDSKSPRSRTKHIVNESMPLLVITEPGEETEACYSGVKVVSFEWLKTKSLTLSDGPVSEQEAIDSSATDPIEVVLYTSGSTGLSKGVRIKHSSLINRLEWQWHFLPLENHERVFVFKTSLTFVDATTEIWGGLLCPYGGPKSLLIVPKEVTTNPQRLVALLNEFKITRLVLVPSLLKAILLYLDLSNDNAHLLDSLKIWICSGETLSVSLARQFFTRFRTGSHRLYNFYGSTEVMGDVTYHEMKRPEDVSVNNKVPIGVPLDNTVIYLMSPQLQPVPMGEIGEMFVAGRNIAAGYVSGREAERFVPNPHALDPNYSSLFRTGDYAKIVKGTLVFEGRTDSQIKVRGNRVDLSEVEAALLRVKGIEKGVVLCHRPGEVDQQVVAFVTCEKSLNLTAYQIEKLLSDSVPKYAIPQVLLVEKMPYLINGKVDRPTLLTQYRNSSSKINSHNGDDISALSKHLQPAGRCLFSVVAEVLGNSVRGKISQEANFFEIGGNSLNSVYAISRLKEQGYNIGITDFVMAPNLGKIIEKMTDSVNGLSSTPTSWEKFRSEVLKDEHKTDVYRIIADSFYHKADIEGTMVPRPEHHEYASVLDCFWEYMIRHPTSLVVWNSEGKMIGASLVMDGDDEPAEADIDGQLSYVMEFLDYVEMPIRENVIPKVKILHSFMLGTDQELSPRENIEITEYMEAQLIEVAKKHGYKGILTTNTSPLTQQLGDVLKYKRIKEYRINEYVAPDGTRPFKRADDEVLAVVQWKQL